MKRSSLVTLAIASLLGAGCGQAPPEADPSAEDASATSRGRHRVRRSPELGGSRSAKVADVHIPMLETVLLDAEAAPFEAGRDPFRYGEVPRPRPTPAPEPKRPEPQPTPTVSRPAEPAPPVAPPFVHSYLGSFGSAGLRIAVFEDSEGFVINAFEGEVLEGKFRILKIGYESVDIEFIGFPDTPVERKEVGG